MPRSIVCAECGAPTSQPRRSLCPACYARLRRREAPEQYRAYNRRHYYKDPDRAKRHSTAWAKKNPDKVAAKARARNAFKKKCREWLLPEHREELRRWERERPPGMHLDHIRPLKGKDVCGLHVPWNLQYLSPKENRKKSNS